MPSWSYGHVLSLHQVPCGSKPSLFDRLVVDSAAAVALDFLAAAAACDSAILEAVVALVSAPRIAATCVPLVHEPLVMEPVTGTGSIAAIIIARCSLEIASDLDESRGTQAAARRFSGVVESFTI